MAVNAGDAQAVEEEAVWTVRHEASRRASALGWAGGMAAAAVVVGAAVNPALGRSVHWDRMAVLAAVLFVALAVALRRRWL